MVVVYKIKVERDLMFWLCLSLMKDRERETNVYIDE